MFCLSHIDAVLCSPLIRYGSDTDHINTQHCSNLALGVTLNSFSVMTKATPLSTQHFPSWRDLEEPHASETKLGGLSRCMQGTGKWQRSPTPLPIVPSDSFACVNRLRLPLGRSKGVTPVSGRTMCSNAASSALIQLSMFVIRLSQNSDTAGGVGGWLGCVLGPSRASQNWADEHIYNVRIMQPAPQLFGAQRRWNDLLLLLMTRSWAYLWTDCCVYEADSEEY